MSLPYTDMTGHADLLLVNARVITLEPGQPATVVAVRGETIAAVGGQTLAAAWRGPRTRTIDCQGMTLLPGLIDAHCHLLALAASLTAVDCGPNAVRSIEELKGAVHRRAEVTPPGCWIRAWGYDDVALVEGRHPTRWELDQAAPHHPVRLDHRSGHATVLNSRGLALAGIHEKTPDPVEGVIQRDAASGEPNGLLLELAGFLRRRLGPLRSQVELADGVAQLDQLLLRWGITSVQDAGPENDLARWETFQGLKASAQLACRVTMLAGVSHLAEFRAAGLRYGDGPDGNRGSLRLGAAKGMLTLTTGALHPDAHQLREMLAEAQRSGFPIAVHAVEREAVEALTQVLQDAEEAPKVASASSSGRSKAKRESDQSAFSGAASRHRIEHCAECPPDLVAQVRRCGATVVTQPGFVYWEGDRYLERVGPSLLPHLYPIGALARAGVPLAFGSDAPVIDSNPWPAIYGAVTRSTREGRSLPPEECSEPGQGVPVEAALRMYTLGGALAEGSQARKGSIAPGKLADLVLLDSDPREVAPSMLKGIRAVLTIIGGQVVWDGGLLAGEAGYRVRSQM